MRIGIIAERPSSAQVLRRTVSQDASHEVLWIADDAAEAIHRCAADTPDLVLVALPLVGMNGVDVIRTIMSNSPCPILIVTASVRASAAFVFDAMGQGALDAVDMPTLDAADITGGEAPLLAKIETISRLIGEKPVSGGDDRRVPHARAERRPGSAGGGWRVGRWSGSGGSGAEGAAEGVSGPDRHRAARRWCVRRGHGRVAEPGVRPACERGQGRRAPRDRPRPRRRRERPSHAENAGAARLHRRAAALRLSPVGGRVLSERQPAVAWRRRRRAVDRNGTRRCAGTQGAARPRAPHDRAG